MTNRMWATHPGLAVRVSVSPVNSFFSCCSDPKNLVLRSWCGKMVAPLSAWIPELLYGAEPHELVLNMKFEGKNVSLLSQVTEMGS